MYFWLHILSQALMFITPSHKPTCFFFLSPGADDPGGEQVRLGG